MNRSCFSWEPKKVPLIETKYRTIKTSIPVPESIPVLEKLNQYESISMHGQLPIVWDRAEDFQVYDAWGNKWLDFTSTIFVTNAGHGNKKIVKAIEKLVKKPLLHTYTFATFERARYLEYLIKNTPSQLEKAFLLSSGTEATEATLKLMRMYGKKHGKRKPGVISFEGNWHGRTMGAQMLCSKKDQKDWVGYLDPNIYHLPFPYPWRKDAVDNPEKYFIENMEKLLNDNNISPEEDLCGFILETFQGWGAFFYPIEFVKAIEKFARKYNLLLAFDEMQSGFGRTGKLFGYMHYNVEPDIIACGKGAGSGVPLSIVLGRKEIMDLPEIGSMSSTHSANPLVCTVGMANFKALIEDGLISNCQKLEKIFFSCLNDIKSKYHKYIRYVQGHGLVSALIFKDINENPLSNLCDKICERAMQKGLLLVHTGRESIKIAPPLSITEEAMLEGMQVLKESIEECINELK